MIHKQQKKYIKTIKHTTINQKKLLQCWMHLWIPFYLIGVAIAANIMPKRDFHAYATRIYTLRFHLPSLFDPFDTFSTFKWGIMPPYKLIAIFTLQQVFWRHGNYQSDVIGGGSIEALGVYKGAACQCEMQMMVAATSAKYDSSFLGN